jgi:mRNA interferase RelE/StbE
MECYDIEWRPSTKKDLKRISKAEVQRIIKAVESLSGQPRPPGATKLSGSNLTYRIRVGNYRIIYEIHDEIILIEIVKVGNRKDVYRK